jgi:HTH-type transcriptional repressor of NAD biosynthesis genes
MTKAFVFGKFLPFHKGHEAMINFALANCDFLSVLVCSSDREKITGAMRKKWIENAFEECKNIEIKLFNYSENDYPNTSETSIESSRIWAEVFKRKFPEYSLLITSEPYGEYVSRIMNIRHIPFDLERKQFPISATSIKSDLFANWNFLPESVKTDLAIKVAVLGTESTGKTTLAEHLAKHYQCSFVPETAREIIANSNLFSALDLSRLAEEHSYRIKKAVTGNSPLVIVDTDIHITKSYSKFILAKTLEVSDHIYSLNKANLYLYLNNDVKYSQDGTRLPERDRNLLDNSHREVLKHHCINFIEIKGNWQNRIEKSIQCIDKLIELEKYPA